MTYYVELRYRAVYNYTATIIEYSQWKLGIDDIGVLVQPERLESYFRGQILKLGVL